MQYGGHVLGHGGSKGCEIQLQHMPEIVLLPVHVRQARGQLLRVLHVEPGGPKGMPRVLPLQGTHRVLHTFLLPLGAEEVHGVFYGLERPLLSRLPEGERCPSSLDLVQVPFVSYSGNPSPIVRGF